MMILEEGQGTSLYDKQISDLDEVVDELIEWAGKNKIWIFTGDLGAGKTTLIQHLCNKLGVIERVSSPTFSIINEYESDNGDMIYHFDFYRLDSEDEAEQLGLEEYFYSDELCLIEWPERIPNHLPDSYMQINITNQSVNTRTYHFSKHG